MANSLIVRSDQFTSQFLTIIGTLKANMMGKRMSIVFPALAFILMSLQMKELHRNILSVN